jgi:biopolymer transport protein ExbD
MGVTPGDSNDLDEVSGINVTPFIDVMLVLLIVFMVAAPLSTVSVPVDLPSSTAKPDAAPDKPVYVTLKADLTLAVGEATVSAELLPQALASATQGNIETRIFLRADRTVTYGQLTEAMNRLRQAGYHKVALVAAEQVTP